MHTNGIRVASVPAHHPYIQHLTSEGGDDDVVRLPDPTPSVPDPAPGQWWPPRMLEPDWVEEHHSEFQLVHLHFGFDDVPPARLRNWLDCLDDHNIPLVFTVHDLVNPHFADQSRHSAQLDVLVRAATELITLTSGAARAIEDRWNRKVTVVPHPHVVPLRRIGRRRPAHDGFVVGLHAKSLRANVDPVPLLNELLGELSRLPGVFLRLDVHPDVLAPDNHDQRAVGLRSWMDAARSRPRVQIHIHPRLDDSDLWDYLESIDLCVLPYRFGTHSGWLEACVDLGTAVLVPSAGYFGEQHGHPVFGPGTRGLVEGIREIQADPSRALPPRPDRKLQREQIAATHAALYRRALGVRTSVAAAGSTGAPEVVPA